MSSAALNWLIVRGNNSYLLKKRDIAKPFSTERNNLTNVSSFRYSGLVHKKTIAVIPADKTGITLLYKKSKYQNRPAKNTVKVTLKHGPRRTLSKLRTILKANKYRTDLHQAALRRASAVLRSQRVPRPLKGKHAAHAAAAAAKKAE